MGRSFHAKPSVTLPLVESLLILSLLTPASAEARTRLVCRYVIDNPFPIPDVVVYPGVNIPCGRDLQPNCTSGAACDSGFSSFSQAPFPYTYDCPSPVPSSLNPTFSAGCFEDVPDCNACGFDGLPPCPEEAEPYCGVIGCRNGLEPDPLTGLCADPVQAGDPCGPAAPCPDGLVCDPFSGFRCTEIAQAGDSCANPFVHCDDGLQCTLALECSHIPAREDETCDATAPCGNGLFCQAGIPQRCEVYAGIGEACDLTRPCIPGARCEACASQFCQAPRLCFWDGNLGLNDLQCAALYNAETASSAESINMTLTFTSGVGVSGGASISQAAGVAYGDDGSYGCFHSECRGYQFDASVEFFVAVGRYEQFADVDGASAVAVTEAQVPGSLANYSRLVANENLVPYPGYFPGATVGEEHAFSIGLGLNPFPFSPGLYSCDTSLSVLVDGSTGGGGPPPPPPPPVDRPGNLATNPHFDSDLAGWSCENGGICSWREDDPLASTVSGSGSVESPASGSTSGRIASACLPVFEGTLYEFSASARAVGPIAGDLYALWSSNPACGGGVVANDLVGVIPNDGQWRQVLGFLPAPPGAVAVTFKATASGDASGALGTTQVDEVYVPEPDAALGGRIGVLVLVGLAALRSTRGRLGRRGSRSTGRRSPSSEASRPRRRGPRP